MKSMRIEKVFVAVTCSPPLQDGNTPLHLASRNGKTELCKCLVGAKANVEMKDKVLRSEIGAGVICVTQKEPVQRIDSVQRDDDVGMQKMELSP